MKAIKLVHKIIESHDDNQWLKEHLDELDTMLYYIIHEYNEILEVNIIDGFSDIQINTRDYIINELLEVAEVQKI